MSWLRCRGLIASDLWRHAGTLGARTFLRHFLATPGFRYSTLLRLCSYALQAPWCQLGMRQLAALALHRHSVLYRIDISARAHIGSGLYIGHFGGIVVNGTVRIGDNCNLSHGVTLGRVDQGERTGCPTIGDDVYIAPGAMVLGGIYVGDRAAVGANAVVIEDVPPDVAVGGIPARVISQQGSQGYVNRTDYPTVPSR